MNKFLRYLLFLLFPLFLGLAPKGCSFIEGLFFYYCIDIPPDIFITNGFGSGVEGDLIYISNDGVIWVPPELCSNDFIRKTVNGNPDLFDITYFGVNNVGNIVVGESGTIIQVTPKPDYKLVQINNPAGSHNLNDIEQQILSTLVFAVGDSGTIIKSTDYGLSWNVVSFPFNVNLKSIYTYSDDHYIVSGEEYSIYETTNNGTTWNPVGLGKFSFGKGATSYNKIYFYNDNYGYIGGPHGIVGKTTNGGINWSLVVAPGFDEITDLLFISPDSGVAVGTNGIARFTYDGGQTWFEDTSITNLLAGRTIKKIAKTGDNFGVIAGDGRLSVIFSPDSNLVGVDDDFNQSYPAEYQLNQNYPNPFNPATNFGFRIADFGFVTLKIYDLLGREVATLVDEEKPAGSYNVEFDASGLSSGVYIYRLKAGSNFIATKKFMLLK